jgi:hypothetical protein
MKLDESYFDTVGPAQWLMIFEEAGEEVNFRKEFPNDLS